MPGRSTHIPAPATPAAGSVTNTMLASMAASTIKGRAAGAGTGAPQDLTVAQVNTMLGLPAAADALASVLAAGNNANALGITNLGSLAFTNAAAVASTLSALGLSGTVLQVVPVPLLTTLTDTTADYSFVVLSGSITLASAASRVLVLSVINYSSTTNQFANFKLQSAGGDIAVGDAAGSRARVSADGYMGEAGWFIQQRSFLAVDAPAAAGARTYRIVAATDAGGTIYINRSITDADSVNYHRAASCLVLVELAS